MISRFSGRLRQQVDRRRPVPVHEPQPGDRLLDLPLADLLEQRLGARVRVHGHVDGRPGRAAGHAVAPLFGRVAGAAVLAGATVAIGSASSPNMARAMPPACRRWARAARRSRQRRDACSRPARADCRGARRRRRPAASSGRARPCSETNSPPSASTRPANRSSSREPVVGPLLVALAAAEQEPHRAGCGRPPARSRPAAARGSRPSAHRARTCRRSPGPGPRRAGSRARPAGVSSRR